MAVAITSAEAMPSRTGLLPQLLITAGLSRLMNRNLHIFQVCLSPLRFIAFEYETEVTPPKFDFDLITWGTAKEYLLRDLVLVLHARSWSFLDIRLAIQDAAERITPKDEAPQN